MLDLSLSIGNIFGSISGVITALGLIVGMYGANIKAAAIIVGLVSIAIGDSISDALGIYYGVNYSNSEADARKQALMTLIAKFSIPMLMTIPFRYMSVKDAVVANILFGILIVFYISNRMFDEYKDIVVNIGILLCAIAITYYFGENGKINRN